MIIINDVSINPEGNLNVNIETGVGYHIISAKLWTKDTFDDNSLAKDFTYMLNQEEDNDNKEVFILTPGDVQLSSFSGLHFVEFKTDQPEEGDCSECSDSILVSVTDFSKYYKCIAESILKASVCSPNMFSSEVCNSSEVTKAMSANLLLSGIIQCLELGQLYDAIDLVNKLDQLCKNCTSCNSTVKLNKTTCTSCNSYY